MFGNNGDWQFGLHSPSGFIPSQRFAVRNTVDIIDACLFHSIGVPPIPLPLLNSDLVLTTHFFLAVGIPTLESTIKLTIAVISG